MRRKADATRDPERRAADQETPRPAVPETSKSGSAPTFTALAERSVLVRPVVTEKATVLSGLGRYAFHVTPKATKTEIRRAVENLFSVHVTRVRLITLPSKLRRRGPIVGSVPGSRKALVTLRKSERIDLSAAMPFEHTPR
ncbi:MAG: 50S ribosomal protein L23 [bacterium]|nr:50S ribosomal protein L23 [bacterium]